MAVGDTRIRERIIRSVQDLETMPTLPVVVERLKQEIEDPNASARSVAALVENDPPTMARVLRLVNSPIYAPAFGQGKNITLDQAVVRLGMNELRNVVITSSVMTLFPATGAAKFDRHEFWRHSICCGFVAAALTEFTDAEFVCSRSEIELAGLCHDIGKVILDEYFHDTFVDVLESAKRDQTLFYEAEQRYLDLNHGQIGGILGARWGLPVPVIDAITHHHTLEKVKGRPTENIAKLIHLADFICNHQGLGISGNGRLMTFPKDVFEDLGISMEIVPDIIERVRDEAKRSEIFLSLAHVKDDED